MVVALIGAAVSLLAGFSSAAAERETAIRNAAMSRIAKREARARGNHDMNILRIQARALMGQQTASLAGQNVAVDSDVALDIAESTAFVTELDAIEAANNAKREAWYHETRAEQGLFEGEARARGKAWGAVGSAIGSAGDYLDLGGE